MKNYFVHVPLLQKWMSYFLLQPQRKQQFQHTKQATKPFEKDVETVYQMKLADLKDFQRRAFVAITLLVPTAFLILHYLRIKKQINNYIFGYRWMAIVKSLKQLRLFF